MRFVSVNTNEYLVIGKAGKLTNAGTAITKFILPGQIYAKVPSTRQETSFEMTQESKDGIPLRFKGIIIYHISDPVIACKHFSFDFSKNEINKMLSDIVLGELRSTVTHMTMNECIEQRKTTLTQSIWSELEKVVSENGQNWGIRLEFVQVAQVFIIDQELRRHMEASIRNEVRKESEISNINTQNFIVSKKVESDQILQQKQNELEIRKIELEKQKALSEMQKDRDLINEKSITNKLNVKNNLEVKKLELAAEQERLEAEQPVKLLEIANRIEQSEKAITMEKALLEEEVLKVDREMVLEKATQALRMELLPIEQRTEIAKEIAKMLMGANLNIYSEDKQLMGWLSSFVQQFSDLVQKK